LTKYINFNAINDLNVHLTFIMKIVETFEDLSDDAFNVISWNSSVVRLDNQFKKIMSKHFKYHANMQAVNAADLEVIEQLDGLIALRIGGIRIAHVF